MSEYLIKKELLDWLNENIKDRDWPYEIRYAFKHVREKIQSGAFDANGEDQRLRVALERIKKWADDPEPVTMLKIWNLANETLKGDGNDA